MKFKEDVDPRYLSAPAWLGLWKADQVHIALVGKQAVCTSTGESKHSVKRSRHYTGEYGFGFANAFDLRTWYVEVALFAERLKEELGEDYVVIIEETHIHVHWAPVFNPIRI